jgi:Protein kinase domain
MTMVTAGAHSAYHSQDILPTPVARNNQKSDGTKSETSHLSGVTSIPVAPHYRNGMKKLFRPLSSTPEWFSVKDALKQTYISTTWRCFFEGKEASSLPSEVREALEKKAEGVEQYIQRKQKQLQFVSGHGAIYQSKGTDLTGDIVRSNENHFFDMPQQMTSQLRTRIKNQHQISYDRPTPKLGEGAFGVVQIAEQINPDASRTVDSKHVLKKYGFAAVQGKSYLFIDFESMGVCTSIQEKIGKVSNSGDREVLQRTLAKQYIEAVKVLHDHGVYHLDIKPDNFLMSKDGVVVIADYGLSTTKINEVDGGTPQFMAPEAWNKGTARADTCDRYSLGITLRTIKNHASIASLFTDATQLQGKNLDEVAAKLAVTDPSKRPTLDEVLKMPYFQGKTLSDAAFAQKLRAL